MLFDDATSIALRRALDGTALRQRVTADNIANVMTPGFAARRVEFEGALAAAVRAGRPGEGQASIATSNAPGRADGNNVVLENETTELMRSGMQYQALAQAMTFKHTLMKTALSRG